jgi:hypothetical protein
VDESVAVWTTQICGIGLILPPARVAIPIDTTPSEIELWGAGGSDTAGVECETISRSKCGSATRLEAEHHASLDAEIVLIVVTARERIAEAR